MSVRVIVAVILLLSIIGMASATITVTPANIGETYINWSWPAGLDVQNIFFDGIAQCGYETTTPYIIQGNLQPNSLHTINISTVADAGSASTYTNYSTSTGSTYYSAATPVAWYVPVLGLLGAIGFCAYRRRV